MPSRRAATPGRPYTEHRIILLDRISPLSDEPFCSTA
jgi:hypothetical protein